MKMNVMCTAFALAMLLVAAPVSSGYAAEGKKQTATERALVRAQKKASCKSICTRKVEKCIKAGEPYDDCRYGLYDGCFERCENM